MRPDATEMVRGVRALLAGEILHAVSAPYLRAQVMIAVGLLDAAVREFEDAPATFAEEQHQILALAREAMPLVHQLAPNTPLITELTVTISAQQTITTAPLSGQREAAAQMLGVLDHLSAFCDQHAESTEVAALGVKVTALLHAVVARRAAWGGFGGVQ